MLIGATTLHNGAASLFIGIKTLDNAGATLLIVTKTLDMVGTTLHKDGTTLCIGRNQKYIVKTKCLGQWL
ncbi:MAG: hypothetical protein IPM82_12715 [Saprospiraceae bacterium]|nr:hypothetical protein [Saprospiraceae bacterium]